MPKLLESNERQVQLSFRIPADLAAALERVAATEDRTVSAELRRLIRRHVAQVGVKADLEAA